MAWSGTAACTDCTIFWRQLFGRRASLGQWESHTHDHSLARSLTHSLTHSCLLLLPSKYTVSTCHTRFVRMLMLLDADSICYNTAAAVFCCQDSVLLLNCVAACCCCLDCLLLFHVASARCCCQPMPLRDVAARFVCCCLMLLLLLPASQGYVHRDTAICYSCYCKLLFFRAILSQGQSLVAQAVSIKLLLQGCWCFACCCHADKV